MMRLKWPSISVDAFRMVYWIIALATSQHTSWGAATTMQGTLPTDTTLAFWWWLQGFAFAAAIDYSMVMVATKLRGGTISKDDRARIWYTVTFVLVATFSIYFQLLYAWHHSDIVTKGAGVAVEWQSRLQWLIDARIVIAPFALPVIAAFYTFGGFGKGGEAQKVARSAATDLQPTRGVIAGDLYISTPAASTTNARLRPAIERRDDMGTLLGYVCPGCNKALSVSGWSRHKNTCAGYRALSVPALELSTNGNHKGDVQ